MQVSTKFRTILAGGAAAAALVATPMAASAHGMQTGSHSQSHFSHSNHSVSEANKTNVSANWHWRKPNPPDCSAAQNALNQKVASYKAAAQKQLTYLNNFSSMVQGYVSDNGITVDNYANLQAQVNADQSAATDAVNAITPSTLNCDGNTQAAFNNSVRTAIQDLQTYRKDLSNLMVAVLNS